MRRLICGYYHGPKDLSWVKCQAHLFFLSIPLPPRRLLHLPPEVFSHFCILAMTLLTSCHFFVLFSPPLCLQEADSVPGPDLCPAAGCSRLPVDARQRKSEKHLLPGWSQERLSITTTGSRLHNPTHACKPGTN